MNIIIIQEAPERARNAEYCVAQCLARAFNRRGVVADVWGKGYRGQSFEDAIKDKDIAIITDNYPTSNWIPYFNAAYSVFYSIDSHIALNQHIAFCKEHRIDCVLCAVKPDVEKFKQAGFRSLWFPLAYPSDLIRPLTISRDYLIGFCGSKGTTERQWWLQSLGKDSNLHFDEMQLGPDMVRAISSYRIGFNRNINYDINARVFETCACDTMLLTNEVEGLGELFEVGAEVVTYGNYEDCVSKINYFSQHLSEINKIASSGLHAVQMRHTYNNRARWFCENI